MSRTWENQGKKSRHKRGPRFFEQSAGGKKREGERGVIQEDVDEGSVLLAGERGQRLKRNKGRSTIRGRSSVVAKPFDLSEERAEKERKRRGNARKPRSRRRVTITKKKKKLKE